MTPGESVAGEELQILVQYQLVAALQEREHDLATAQRLAHLGSWSMDVATGVVTWSDELYRIFGLTEEATTPSLEAFLPVVHPDERSKVEDAVRQALAARRPFRLQYRIRRPDGQERWVRSSGAVDVDAENVVIRMHGITQDVTDIEAVQRAEPNGSGTGQGALDPEAAPGRGGNSQAEPALRRALDERQFLLHYQPKVSIESDRITGAEALLRWEDPERGLVPPLEFISIAEESGLIVPIGTWVIEEACRQVGQWHMLFPRRPPLVVSVNVSGRQFVPELIEVVTSALAAAGIDAAQLCLEVTESILSSDSDGAVATLNGLAALGLKLSIDDFGTGYSSLSALKRFPLSELKIDKSFVDGLGHDPDDTAIVSATVSMAHALELSVVAEGVETAEQFEHLRVLGCQEVQGYLVSRPRPAGGFGQLLAEEATVGWRSALQEAPTDLRELYRPDRVLVVDDSPEVRQLAQMTLAAAGFEVNEASDGARALEAVQNLLPDCVLLDVSMPGMSGMDVCRALRSDPSTAGCTIVMLTSNAEAADKVEAFSYGADDYMVKPFSPRDLVSRLRAAMRRRSDAANPL
ncbi:MAG TPA: EAL domain-containing protein [Acidimicrobiales bacterium]|nr:EAL domain-containing protein [Acidimicrobiales bacterium]